MLRVRTAIDGWVGGPGLMTQYFLTPLQDAAAALRAATYVHNLMTSPISGSMPNSVTLTVSPDVDVLDAATGEITDTHSVTAPAVITCSGGESIAPPAVAALLQLRTGVFIAGRRVRGRTFVSPLAAAFITTDGILSNTAQTDLEVAHANMVTWLESGDSWVVWHRPKAGAGGAAAPITSTTVPFKLAVLTSRRD